MSGQDSALLAFRLLVDIGLRAQSPAINEPATCRHTIDAGSGLLRYLADRDLAIADITSPDRHARLLLHPPTWQDYVAAAVDELIEAGRATPSVAARLVKVLDDLTLAVPAAGVPSGGAWGLLKSVHQKFVGYVKQVVTSRWPSR